MTATAVPSRQAAMLAVVAAAALASFAAPPYPDQVLLQNVPTLLGAAGLWAFLRRNPLPDAAVACAVAFLLLHTLGGRYSYSYVPYERWLSDLGLPTVRDLTGMERNGYDRLVHTAFGLLGAPFVRAALRSRGLSRGLSTYVAIEFVAGMSCVYEIFEWILTLVMAGPDADLYNGQQGDMWDAQKDMACATAGAIVSACAIHFRRKA